MLTRLVRVEPCPLAWDVVSWRWLVGLLIWVFRVCFTSIFGEKEESLGQT